MAAEPKEIRLTPTSYIALGMIEACGEATPYDLKGMVVAGVGNIWSLQHAQLYSEPQKLAGAGYLSERREQGGRRRRHYGITEKGRTALREWLAEPTEETTQGRIPSLLKLLLGTDPALLAAAQLPAHRDKLAEYEELRRQLGPETPEALRLTLEAGIDHEREWVRYWARLANLKGKGEQPAAAASPRPDPAPDEIQLTPTSYIVLSLLEAGGETTPYELKAAVADWEFWPLQHAQLYREPERLAEAGYLSARREQGGRRRRHYGITEKGRAALREWLAVPTDQLEELRDLALLKLFFGADPKRLAAARLPVHRSRLAQYEEMLAELDPEGPPQLGLGLEAAIGHERIWIGYWTRLAGPDGEGKERPATAGAG